MCAEICPVMKFHALLLAFWGINSTHPEEWQRLRIDGHPCAQEKGLVFSMVQLSSEMAEVGNIWGLFYHQHFHVVSIPITT